MKIHTKAETNQHVDSWNDISVAASAQMMYQHLPINIFEVSFQLID